ncbi:MAG: transglutaminase-like domain-containing protein [Puniceicoccales bacterium]|nr:transglutaminase-like domain-containing protein [Puniceicoccales bacterium]
MPLAKTAEDLIQNTDTATALVILNYIVNHFEYNDDSVPLAGYIPNLNQVFMVKIGICYDFAALYAGMCRSIGIPCKLVI